MVKRLVTLIALLLVVLPGVGIAQAAPTTTRAVSAIGGALISESATPGGATTLVISTTHFGQVTVNISTATPIVRRYNGVSALDELSLNDFLMVNGSFAPGSTSVFNATRVKDFTIQEAATRAVLLVTQVSTTTTSFKGVVLRDSTSRLRPFDEGTPLTVMVSSSGTFTTTVQMWAHSHLQAATFSNIQAGQRVTVLGVYNRRQRTFIKTLFVRVRA